MRPFYTIILTCLFSSVFAQKQVVHPPESVGMSSERLERLNTQMHQFVNEGSLSAVQTAIFRKDKLVHFNSYGHQDVESQKPIGENSIWRIYSMTKPIVSVALMMLYEEGHFQLYDPLHKYIPEFKEVQVHVEGSTTKLIEQPIKIVDVLRHTSGFGYGWGPGNYVDSLYKAVDRKSMKDNAAFAKGLAKLPLYHSPGTGWRYGVSTDMCGYLVEVLSGQPLDQFLEERIFQPLKMNDTHFEVPDDKDNRFVTNYTTREGKMVVIDHPSESNYTKEVTLFSGGGGLVSTTGDYLRFSRMLLNKGKLESVRLLSRKTIELMTVDHCKDIPYTQGPVVLPAKGTGFGLGFAVTNTLANTEMTGSEGAFGWGGAAGTYFRIDPKEELIYIMMIQLMPYNHLQAREKFQTMVYQAIID